MTKLAAAKSFGFIAWLDSSLGALTFFLMAPVLAGLRALNAAIKAAQVALDKRSQARKLNSTLPSIRLVLPHAPKLENVSKVWLN